MNDARARTLRGEGGTGTFGRRLVPNFSCVLVNTLSGSQCGPAKRVDDPLYGDGCKVGTESGSVYVCEKKAVGLRCVWTRCGDCDSKSTAQKICNTVTVSYPSFIFYIANVQ